MQANIMYRKFIALCYELTRRSQNRKPEYTEFTACWDENYPVRNVTVYHGKYTLTAGRYICNCSERLKFLFPSF